MKLSPPLCAVFSLLALPAGLRAAHPFHRTDSFGNKVAAVSADEKIEWKFADRERFLAVNPIQLLGAPGDPAKGEILH